MERGCFKALRLQHLHARAVKDLRRLREKPIDYSVLDPRLFEDGSWLTGLRGEHGRSFVILPNGGLPDMDDSSHGVCHRQYWSNKLTSSTIDDGLIDIHEDVDAEVGIGDMDVLRRGNENVEVYTLPLTTLQPIIVTDTQTFKSQSRTRNSLSDWQQDDAYRLQNAYPRPLFPNTSSTNKQINNDIPIPGPGKMGEWNGEAHHLIVPHIWTRECDENCRTINNRYSTSATSLSNPHHALKRTQQHTSLNSQNTHTRSPDYKSPPHLRDQIRKRLRPVRKPANLIYWRSYQSPKFQNVISSKLDTDNPKQALLGRMRAENRARVLAQSCQRQKRRTRRQLISERLLHGKLRGTAAMDWRWWKVAGRGSVLKREIKL
jgi:hypothetical protein